MVHQPEPSMSTRSRSLVRMVASTGALVVGIGVGCLVDLPRGRSCGDGWWDPEYEECDPSSADHSYVDACRAQGWNKDADCDPNTCEVRASEAECARCGDGVASADEACDGNDVRGATCPSGSGVVRCTDECKLDYDLCPPVCGDGHVSSTEECEPTSCGSDEDCGPDRVCYELLGECVPGDGGFGPNRACGFFNTTAIGINKKIEKPYASGNIWRCTDDCLFGRNFCGFCGDGELDGGYHDLVFPSGEFITFPAEVCDGEEANQEELEAYCEPLCVNDPINADVIVLCKAQCNANCTDFSPPQDIVPNPDSLECCLAKNSPCPLFNTQGVPDLDCCSWAEHPEWVSDQEKCVPKVTEDLPISFVCR